MERYSAENIAIDSVDTALEVEGGAVSSSAVPSAGDGTSFYHRFIGQADFLGQCLNKSKAYQPLKRRGDGDIGAGHVGRYISLANPDRASAFACYIPAIYTYTMIATGIGVFFWSEENLFFVGFIALGAYVIGWSVYMCFLAFCGVREMRKTVAQDWDAKLKTYLAEPENRDAASGMLHFCVIPNYAEDESMLGESIQVFAESEWLAREHMVVVLAMEAREKEAGMRKAQNLIEKHGHRFKAMFATYHPASIQGEVKGKSSNTQWAFRDIQRWYGSYVSQNPDESHDPSKVFITIADADSIFQKQYFACLTYNALNKTPDERAWCIWQPPILGLRNIETVPAPIRCCGYGSFIFEVSGLFGSRLFDHLCFSTYSLSLALANHPIVDGWDADVIAEDHHMFLKCLFASYWEDLFREERSVRDTSKLRIEPIWCPVTSYLVEEETYWGSMYARYQQSRRHMQGIAELSYICLQHFTISQTSKAPLPWKAHFQMFHLALKYATVTIINHVYTLGIGLFAMYGAFIALRKAVRGEIKDPVQEFENAREEPIFNILVLSVQIFLPICSSFAVLCNWAVVKDTMEGRYCPLYLQNTDPSDAGFSYDSHTHCNLIRDAAGSQSEAPSEVSSVSSDTAVLKQSGLSLAKLSGKPHVERVLKSRTMTFRSQIRLLFQIYTDLNLIGQLSLFIFGTVPLLLQSVSLAKYGHKFDYVVAGKPPSKNDADSTSSCQASTRASSGAVSSTSESLSCSSVSSDVEGENHASAVPVGVPVASA